MSTSTLATTLIVNNTQEISEISTIINDSDAEIPTAGAIYNFFNQFPKSLTISGDWANTQYANYAVDSTGLIFTVTYLNGETEIIPVSSLDISPAKWADSDSAGEQTATFFYTYLSIPLMFTWAVNKTATVEPTPIIINSNFKADTTITTLNFTT